MQSSYGDQLKFGMQILISNGKISYFVNAIEIQSSNQYLHSQIWVRPLGQYSVLTPLHPNSNLLPYIRIVYNIHCKNKNWNILHQFFESKIWFLLGKVKTKEHTTQPTTPKRFGLFICAPILGTRLGFGLCNSNCKAHLNFIFGLWPIITLQPLVWDLRHRHQRRGFSLGFCVPCVSELLVHFTHSSLRFVLLMNHFLVFAIWLEFIFKFISFR